MNISTKAIIKASGIVLTEYLTEELINGDDAELYEYLVDNACELHQWRTGSAIWDSIREIADAIREGV
jgi:hypothetical protein